jgi:hypothetical protein
MKRSNVVVIALAVIAIAAWGLVARQEIESGVLRPLPSSSRGPSKGRRPPEAGPGPAVIPAGSSIKLPAPKDDRPTEAAPAIEIVGTITDAKTGRPVVADVRAANVFLDNVTQFRLIFPAACPEPCRRGDEAIQITVTAPGYQEWSIGIKPHIAHSKVFTTPIKLKRKPAGDQT